MFRHIKPEDTDEIIELAVATGVFKPLEIATLRELLKDYHKEDREQGHRAFAWEDAGRIIGYVYYAPTPMTERTWHLYWIVVDTRLQRRGLGAELLGFVEKDIRGFRGRMLLVETSLLPHYEPTRRFYLKNGYTILAEIADFYAEGDGMIIFCKRLHKE
jgi:ribosomal protein S18 acetylase RimI-like enzyme